MNQPGLRLMEIDNFDDFHDRSWPELWGQSRNLAASALASATTAGEARFQGLCPTAKGAAKWWDVIVTTIRDSEGQVAKIVCFSRDVTSQKEAEDERNQLLASERSARSEAERSARVRTNSSHALPRAADAAQRHRRMDWRAGSRTSRTTRWSKAVDVIDRNSLPPVADDRRPARRQPHRFRQTAPGHSARRSRLGHRRSGDVGAAGADAKAYAWSGSLGNEPIVQGDPVRLQQVVWNPGQQRHQVQQPRRDGAGHAAPDRGCAQLQVSDKGQGIAVGLLPMSFSGSARATHRRRGGMEVSGWVWPSSKIWWRCTGGSVDATSEGIGKGSLFTVKLPLALSGGRRLESESAEPTGELDTLLTGVVAMVIDDEPDGRDLVQRLLQDAGAAVSAWASVEEALQSIRDGFVPDVIVSDVGMPDQDGYDFMSRVRQMNGPIASVPAAALTALARVQDRRRARWPAIRPTWPSRWTRRSSWPPWPASRAERAVRRFSRTFTTCGRWLGRRVVALEEAIDFGDGAVAIVSVAFLNQADELVRVALDLIELVVGQLAPLYFRFAFQLLPLAADDVRVHRPHPFLL